MRVIDPVKHDLKRREILVAAATCFARKGFERTRTADICAEAGMSSGNLFHYFPSKKAILTAIFEQDGQDMAERLAQAASSDDPWGKILELVEHSVIEAADPIAAGLALAISAHASHDEEFGALLAENDHEFRKGLEALLERAARLKQIDSSLDPAMIASWIMLLIDGVFSRIVTEPEFKPREQLPTLRLMLSRFVKARTR
jgi:AcrR family transcriptional regulator